MLCELGQGRAGQPRHPKLNLTKKTAQAGLRQGRSGRPNLNLANWTLIRSKAQAGPRGRAGRSGPGRAGAGAVGWSLAWTSWRVGPGWSCHLPGAKAGRRGFRRSVWHHFRGASLHTHPPHVLNNGRADRALRRGSMRYLFNLFLCPHI